jgi:cell wall-associated NlpC family hydrolase
MSAGVDCVNLAAAIYEGAGVIEKFDPPPYKMDGGHVLARSQIYAWLNDSSDFYEIPSNVRQPGDLICFNLGGVSHHVGVLLEGNQIIHAMQRAGVVKCDYGASLLRRTDRIYRPMAFRNYNHNTIKDARIASPCACH